MRPTDFSGPPFNLDTQAGSPPRPCRKESNMNRKLVSLATLFAAGAVVATSAAPRATASSTKSNSDKALLEVGCGADKDKKDGSCGKDKKDAKDHKCGKDAKGKKDSKSKKDASCGKDKKDKKDASCGKGSCGSKQ